MSNLSETINELMTPRLFERVSAQSGVPDSKVRVGLNGAVATILDGLVNKAHDPRAMGQLTELAKTTPGTETPDRLLDDDVAAQRTSDHLLGVVGGDPQGMVARVGRFVGVGGKAASGMVAAASAVIVGGVRKLAMEPGGLDPSALSTRLLDERTTIHAAVPPAMLGGDQERFVRGERVVVAGPRGALDRAEPRTERPVGASATRPWWVIGLLGLAALLAVIWLAGRSRPKAPAVHTPTTSDHRPVTAPSATAPATPSRPSTSAALTFPAGSPAAQLLDDIRSPSAPGEGTPIGLDLPFASGQATLEPAARDEIANVANVLAAYPNARIKIIGYGEPGAQTPNPAQAQQRADAVQQALIARGVDASRIEATGAQGPTPTEPGSTEQGAHSVAIQVTAR